MSRSRRITEGVWKRGCGMRFEDTQDELTCTGEATEHDGGGFAVNISLTPELNAFVEGKVAAGQYGSVSDVVGEALRLWEKHEQERARELTRFQQEMQRRMASLDRGEGLTPEELQAHFRKKAAMHQQALA